MAQCLQAQCLYAVESSREGACVLCSLLALENQQVSSAALRLGQILVYNFFVSDANIHYAVMCYECGHHSLTINRPFDYDVNDGTLLRW